MPSKASSHGVPACCESFVHPPHVSRIAMIVPACARRACRQRMRSYSHRAFGELGIWSATRAHWSRQVEFTPSSPSVHVFCELDPGGDRRIRAQGTTRETPQARRHRQWPARGVHTELTPLVNELCPCPPPSQPCPGQCMRTTRGGKRSEFTPSSRFL